MRVLLQRVSRAEVRVEGSAIGRIGPGLLVLVGVEEGDGPAEADYLADKTAELRIFPDEAGRMNRSLEQIAGQALVVSQFTLAADTRKGTRASFTSAAPPEDGKRLFDYLLEAAQARHQPVGSGQFGQHMLVSLTNDGPVTFWLEVPPPDAT